MTDPKDIEAEGGTANDAAGMGGVLHHGQVATIRVLASGRIESVVWNVAPPGDDADARLAAALERIKELEAQEDPGPLSSWPGRAERAEAQLAQAREIIERHAGIAGQLDTPTGLVGRDPDARLAEYARRCEQAAARLRADREAFLAPTAPEQEDE